MVNDSLYSVPEAAAKLGLTEQRVRQMCKEGLLPGAEKRGERWTIPGRSVLERFAVKPPKPRPDHEAALNYASRMIKELAEGNARLGQVLSRAEESERNALQELEAVKRKLASRERDLQVADTHSERLRQKLDEKETLITELRERLKSAEQGRMMGARRPRLKSEADTDRGPRGQGRRP